MYSYQEDFLTVRNIPKDFYDLAKSYFNTYNVQDMLEAKSYYDGKNVTVSLLKRYYFNDDIIKDGNGNPVLNERGEPLRHSGFVENPYVANNKIGYGFFSEMVNQKVDTLLAEIPTTYGYTFDKTYLKNFSYALHEASIEASCCGKAFVFQAVNGEFTVFETDKCVPFYDDETGNLKALIRQWTVEPKTGKVKTFIEVYDQEKITKYVEQNGVYTVVSSAYYRFNKIQSKLSSTIIPNNAGFPVFELKNNKNSTSDLTFNIRSKIDSIDIVTSGFANNIEDFADVFWTIKTSQNLSGEYYESFVANISKSKKVFGEDVEPHQISIPTEARSKFVEERKKELYEDGGVIDTSKLTGGSLTNVAIKASTMGLQRRTSSFEWQVYQTAMEMLKYYIGLNTSVPAELDITFNWLIIDNVTETIQNAVLIKDSVSQKTFLTMLQKSNIINDIDEEIEEINKDMSSRYAIE